MRAYKFLARGRIGPFSGHEWPRPSTGRWVETSGRPAVCRHGVHACRRQHLPYWLHDELWVVELDGAVVEEGNKIAAERGRLVARVAQWKKATASAFAHACAQRARQFATDHLLAQGLKSEAAAVEGSRSLSTLLQASERLATEHHDAAVLVAYAADALDGARRGWSGLTATTGAYAAAYAAGHEAGYETERGWQAATLVQLLDLA